MLEKDICGHVKKMEPIMLKHMDRLIAKHNSLRQGRLKGLFGAFDLVGKDGQLIVKNFNDPVPPEVNKFKAKLHENGIQTWVRPPVFHLAPPLIINEAEIDDTFSRIDDALKELDH